MDDVAFKFSNVNETLSTFETTPALETNDQNVYQVIESIDPNPNEQTPKPPLKIYHEHSRTFPPQPMINYFENTSASSKLKKIDEKLNERLNYGEQIKKCVSAVEPEPRQSTLSRAPVFDPTSSNTETSSREVKPIKKITKQRSRPQFSVIFDSKISQSFTLPTIRMTRMLNKTVWLLVTCMLVVVTAAPTTTEEPKDKNEKEKTFAEKNCIAISCLGALAAVFLFVAIFSRTCPAVLCPHRVKVTTVVKLKKRSGDLLKLNPTTKTQQDQQLHSPHHAETTTNISASYQLLIDILTIVYAYLLNYMFQSLYNCQKNCECVASREKTLPSKKKSPPILQSVEISEKQRLLTKGAKTDKSPGKLKRTQDILRKKARMSMSREFTKSREISKFDKDLTVPKDMTKSKGLSRSKMVIKSHKPQLVSRSKDEQISKSSIALHPSTATSTLSVRAARSSAYSDGKKSDASDRTEASQNSTALLGPPQDRKGTMNVSDSKRVSEMRSEQDDGNRSSRDLSSGNRR
ncbi:hypothetical protein HELRODRAFT_172615 [Helobdella robusta]|uniref:Uncharacterized protein n=1 Tax=Helobdella robusta TaxID=6412 RepID=T1F5M8_HELRO|nr:hypothetical protein HELRODRAFT_172615 [Helobdella robusta]ESO04259.1 hypothetical protein HELRODRAFT_172615 [Helobdella robusta]